jgi:hypothetical protein
VTRHVDAETLARYRQEDLSRRRGSRIRAHLARCERCRALDEDLAGVTVLLADMQPPPMPEHLAARIQTALAAEAARRVALPAQAASAAPGAAAGDEVPQSRTAGTGVSDRRTSRHGRHGRDLPRRLPGFTSPVALRTMAAAAAVVVLAGGGYEIATHVGGSGKPSPALSGPAAAGSGATAPRAAGPESGANGTASAAPQLHYEYAGRQYSVTAVVSSTNFTPANLRSQVRSDLAPSGATGTVPRALRSSASAAQQGATVGGIEVLTLQGCVNRIAAGHRVLLVDVARYKGQPATVIVTAASAGSPEQVWVAGTGCSSGSSDLLAHATLAPAG